MVMRTIGADPECFLEKDGQHVSVCGKIGGTKAKPKRVARGFAIQEDNVAVEYNIPACDSREEFIASISFMNDHVEGLAKALGYTISKDASASFVATELLHPNALIFGCEPDYNAWTKTENPSPVCADISLRTCGGHVHVGTDVNMIHGVNMMDLWLGVPSIILDQSPSSAKRRQLYGKAGAMRPKEYGFEYRTLSNFWIFTPELTGWVYDNTSAAMMGLIPALDASAETRIQDAINNSDVKLAKVLVKQYSITMP